jgi:branched-chain amino acid transport system substrate-binding protein
MSFFRRGWAASLLLLLAGCAAKHNSEPVQVAHLLPLTGSEKKAAEDARRGLLLAVEDINAEDQRIGGRTVVVRDIDTHDDPELVQAEAVRLVTLNKVVAFVAGPDSHGAERLVRTAQSYGVPVIVPSDFPPATGVDDFVGLNVAPARRGELLARYAVKEIKPKRALVLTDQRDPVAVGVAAAFVQEWPRGNSPLEEWPFRNDTEQIDFASRLAKVGAAVVLFAGAPADLLKLQGQLHELKASATLLYGGEDLGLEALRKPGVEVLTATVFAPDSLTNEGKEFAKRYEERFHEPVTFAAAQAYDAGRLLFDTMHQVKTGSSARVREELLRLDSFESLTGKVTWQDHKTQRPVFLVQIKNGEAKTVQTVAPDEK